MFEDVTDDAALGGKLRLLQPRKGHRFGHDAVLLAAAVDAGGGGHVVELGAGVGLAGLAVAWRLPAVRVTLVEIDPRLAALAEENARRNGLADRVRVVTLDVDAPPAAFAEAGLSPGSAQHVMMNPPFNPADARVSPDPGRARAYVSDAGLLARWSGAAARLLADGGTLTLIWRAADADAVTAALAPAFGEMVAMPVYPRAGASAVRVVVTAKKGSRAPSCILPGIILQDAAGRPSKAAERILRRGEPLRPLAADMPAGTVA